MTVNTITVDKWPGVTRPMEPKDVPGALVIAKEGWDRATAQVVEPDFQEMFSARAYRPFYYVAELFSDDHIIGIAGYSSSLLYWGIYEIFWVGVAKKWQGKGLGKKLVTTVLEDIEPIADAILLVTDKPKFYHPFGFKETHNFHRLTMSPDPHDVLMIKEIK